MKQSVCSAEIYECTEIGDILDLAFDNIADLDLLEELSHSLFLLRYEQLLAIADDASLLGIEFGDNELDLLILVLVQILLIDIRNKTCRDKYSGLVNDNNDTAKADLNNVCLKYLFVLECFLKPLASALSSKLAVR